MNDIEVRINKEVRDYQEGIFFGLTLRQFLCAFGAVAVALAVYFFLGPALGGSDVGWACVLAAAPFALCGFYRYNSMTSNSLFWRSSAQSCSIQSGSYSNRITCIPKLWKMQR